MRSQWAHLVLFVLASACLASAPRQPREPEGDARRRAIETARAALESAGVLARLDVPSFRTTAAPALASRTIAEAELLGWLDAIAATQGSGGLRRRSFCRDNDIECERVVATIWDALEETATERAIPTFLRLTWFGSENAFWALPRLNERGLDASRHCSPPTAAEIHAAESSLDDFAVIRVRQGFAVAETLTAAERADLAYFMASIDPTTTPIEHGRGDGETECTNDQRARQRSLHTAIESARRAGDLSALVAAERRYLEAWGYPGPTCRVGPRFSGESNSLAWTLFAYGTHLELAKRLGDAAEAYRRAAPFEQCGYCWEQTLRAQIHDVIRVERRAGRCRAAVPELLFAASTDDEFGPRFLAESGFDVARLYRGAAVTRNRGEDVAMLEAILRRGPEGAVESWVRRLRERGSEDWTGRTRAIAGIADTMQRAAIPVLAGFVADGDIGARGEALSALADLAIDFGEDPCVTHHFYGNSSGGRHVAPLDARCSTSLRPAQRRALTELVERSLHDSAPDVRAAAIRALWTMSARGAAPALDVVMRTDPFFDEATETWPVRDEARAALDALR